MGERCGQAYLHITTPSRYMAVSHTRPFPDWPLHTLASPLTDATRSDVARASTLSAAGGNGTVLASLGGSAKLGSVGG